MSIFAFICPYQLLTLKKKVTFCQLFPRPGPCDPYALYSLEYYILIHSQFQTEKMDILTPCEIILLQRKRLLVIQIKIGVTHDVIEWIQI